MHWRVKTHSWRNGLSALSQNGAILFTCNPTNKRERILCAHFIFRDLYDRWADNTDADDAAVLTNLARDTYFITDYLIEYPERRGFTKNLDEGVYYVEVDLSKSPPTGNN